MARGPRVCGGECFNRGAHPRSAPALCDTVSVGLVVGTGELQKEESTKLLEPISK